MNLGNLTKEQISEIVARHKARDISYFSPSYERHARIRWKLYNAEIGFTERKSYGPEKA